MTVIDRFLAPDAHFQERFFFLAKRFVAGETIDSAMDAIAALNRDGLRGTLDFLGEDVATREEAIATRDTYVRLLVTIRERALDTNVSVKLTAMGLSVDETFAYENLRAVIDAAAPNADPFVRIDMEGSANVDATLRVFERAHEGTPNVGPVLQAYLKRTPGDVDQAIALGARVRLCKGAYSEPPEIAYKAMPTIRREYVRLAEALLTRGVYPGIATHDESIIGAVKTFAAENGIGKERFEFQLLYGVRPELQRALARDGYNVRVYVPFGTHWAGYFYRRLTERKENVFFVLRSLLTR